MFTEMYDFDIDGKPDINAQIARKMKVFLFITMKEEENSEKKSLHNFHRYTDPFIFSYSITTKTVLWILLPQMGRIQIIPFH